LQLDAGAKIFRHAITHVRRSGDLNASRRRAFPETFEGVGDAGPACGFPLEAIAGGGSFEAFYQSVTADGHSVADLQGGEAGHELAGAALAHSEDFLHPLAVQIIVPERPQFR
jgi:hypothetical protein